MALKVQKREIAGKKVKTLREKDLVPASLYGAQRNPSLNLMLNKKDLLKSLKENGYSKVFEIEVEGESKPVNVVFKEIQKDPVSGFVIHVSFHQIEMDKKITAEIPVIFSGVSMAVKNNLGLLITSLNKISVSCLPKDLPGHIEVDIGSLNDVGDVISLDKIKLPEGVEVGHGTPHDAVLIYISAPQKIEEEVPAATTAVEGAEGVEGAAAVGAEGAPNAAAGAPGAVPVAGEKAGEKGDEKKGEKKDRR
jgi:large subunit ribosomal protein L25